MEISNKLMSIQASLKAPKGQFNNFGKYKYRSMEDINEALKPLLKEHNCALLVSDTVVEIGTRIYVQATAKLLSGGEDLSVTAYAREPENRKGMDEAQVTGATSSYARKYALNGLFAIDDTQDADSMNQGPSTNAPREPVVTMERARITAKRLQVIQSVLQEREVDIQQFMDYYSIQHLDQMYVDDYAKALELLKQKPLKKGTATHLSPDTMLPEEDPAAIASKKAKEELDARMDKWESKGKKGK